MNRTELIMNTLAELCVPAHLKGYRYLIKAIELCIDDSTLIDSIIGRLYPAVAEAFSDTAAHVQRAIRHAICCSYNNAGDKGFKKYFGWRGKDVTNSEYIATLTFRLKLII